MAGRRRKRTKKQEITPLSTRIKKDDEVVVVAGSEKGKRGKVMHIDTDKNRIVVQGVKRIKRYQRPSQENPQGGEIELETGIHISNVMYYDSKLKKGVKLGRKVGSDGKKTRVTRPEGKEV